MSSRERIEGLLEFCNKEPHKNWIVNMLLALDAGEDLDLVIDEILKYIEENYGLE